MCKKKSGARQSAGRPAAVDVSPLADAVGPDFWPKTKTDVLRKASAGDWSAFLSHYVEPCCREIASRVRLSRNSQVDADDAFQELVLRLMRGGTYGPRLQAAFVQFGQQPGTRANLPARYLRFRELPLRSVKFRHFLKSTIRNVLREAARRHKWHLRAGTCPEAIEPWIEESISHSLDQRWIIDCLGEAAEQLRDESRAARTASPRRYFETLFRVFVEGSTVKDLAGRSVRDRSVASRDWKSARARFLSILQEISGVADVAELRELVTEAPGALRSAFVRASGSP